jgi:hypothetical protein
VQRRSSRGSGGPQVKFAAMSDQEGRGNEPRASRSVGTENRIETARVESSRVEQGEGESSWATAELQWKRIRDASVDRWKLNCRTTTEQALREDAAAEEGAGGGEAKREKKKKRKKREGEGRSDKEQEGTVACS